MKDEPLFRELRQAWRDGTRVLPVAHRGDKPNVVEKRPRWLRKQHVFDVDAERDALVNQLRLPYQRRRVPFMAPHLEPTYVSRSALENEIRGRLFHPKPEHRMVAAVGIGGSGKTALAVAIAHDERVQDEFVDGILWAWLESTDVQTSLNAMYMEMTGEAVAFPSSEIAALNLAKALDRKRCLIVLDGAVDPAAIEPFMLGGPDCVRLLLTRNWEAARGAAIVEVGEMTPQEAQELFSRAGYKSPYVTNIAEALGNLPIALDLARSTLEQRTDRGEAALDSAVWLLSRLRSERDYPLAALDAAGGGLSHLDSVTRKRLLQLLDLGSTEVPLDEVRRVWRLDVAETEQTVRVFETMALAKLDLAAKSVHLHPVLVKVRSGVSTPAPRKTSAAPAQKRTLKRS